MEISPAVPEREWPEPMRSSLNHAYSFYPNFARTSPQNTHFVPDNAAPRVVSCAA